MRAASLLGSRCWTRCFWSIRGRSFAFSGFPPDWTDRRADCRLCRRSESKVCGLDLVLVGRMLMFLRVDSVRFGLAENPTFLLRRLIVPTMLSKGFGLPRSELYVWHISHQFDVSVMMPGAVFTIMSHSPGSA